MAMKCQTQPFKHILLSSNIEDKKISSENEMAMNCQSQLNKPITLSEVQKSNQSMQIQQVPWGGIHKTWI